MKKIFFFAIFLALVGVFFALDAKSLTISPAKFVIKADPGQVVKLQMRIRNDSDRTLTHTPSFERYTVASGGEEPVFSPSDRGLPTWITSEPSLLTLGPEETAEVDITINIPDNAPPGGHYAAIFWQTAPPEGKAPGAVGIITRVGALLLLEISGEVIEQGEIVRFGADKKFFTRLPIHFTLSVKNTGTVHLAPAGSATIKNIFGKTRATLAVNPGGYHVLPGTTRTFYTQSWEPEPGMPESQDKGFFAELKKERQGFALGYYTANLDIEYGQQRKTAFAKFGFWIFPWRLALVSVLILAIIILIFTKGIHKYNQWVIARARKSI